jgi:hypothetical protein
MDVRDGTDLNIELASSPFVIQHIVNTYVDEVVILIAISNRELTGCKEKLAVSLGDDSSAHCSDEVLDKLARRWIFVITFPPRTSHAFQILDVLSFGIPKQAKKDRRRDDNLRREGDHVIRLFTAREQAEQRGEKRFRICPSRRSDIRHCERGRHSPGETFTTEIVP